MANANHTLSLTSSDVLVLGVKNSVVSNGHQQMRIDGDAGDTVLLNDLVGGSTFAWQAAASPAQLNGQNYTLYSNSALGLDPASGARDAALRFCKSQENGPLMRAIFVSGGSAAYS